MINDHLNVYVVDIGRHRECFGSTVRQMFVNKDRHSMSGGLEDLVNLSEILAAGVELLEFVVVGVVAMLADQEDGVDGELAGAESQGVGDIRAQADVVPFGLVAAEVGGVADLFDVDARDVEVGNVRVVAVVDREAVEETADDVIRV